MSLPRFHTQCDWGNTGDVTIYYDEALPREIECYVEETLSSALRSWNDEHRTIYHLETFIEDVFKELMRDGKLRKSPITKTWVCLNG